MFEPFGDGLLRLHENNKQTIESLFGSEEAYWLTMAVATGFALQELLEGEARAGAEAETKALLARFQGTLRAGAVDEETYRLSRTKALAQLEAIRHWMRGAQVFQPRRAMALSRCFVQYWLFSKLIEIEWQSCLETKSLTDSYIFLDGLIADQEELSHIEARLSEAALCDDERIYLQTHWASAREFFYGLENTLRLLDRGLIRFVSICPYRPKA